MEMQIRVDPDPLSVIEGHKKTFFLTGFKFLEILETDWEKNNFEISLIFLFSCGPKKKFI